MQHATWLTNSLIYLAAAVIAVPLARLLGLGAIIGYLGAGIAIGPWGLGLVTDPEQILHFAEFGVVLMLFLVGLELEPGRLWAMRRPIFGWGSVQMAGCTAALFAAALALGVPWKLALVGAIGLAMSSTAIALGTLAERNLMSTSSGHSLLSIALLQDIAAIPILALVPLLGVGTGRAEGNWLGVLQVIGVVAAIVLGGRLLLRPTLRWIASSRTPEIFTAAALLLVVGVAALMQWLSLSMALGAFLAGVLLAESEYRRELETDVEPFKGLLLGLFFIAVGMSIDFGVVREHPGLVTLVVLAFLAIKLAVMGMIARLIPLPLGERPVFVVLLAQGGEFGFVVFQAATQARVMSEETASLLVAAVAISMLVTPLLLVSIDRWLMPRLARGAQPQVEELTEPQNAPIIIAGFGRYGQIVGRLLYANGLRATVLDHDADQVEVVRRLGWRVYYGDATRLDLLRTAGAAGARVLVLAVGNVEHSLEIADVVREHFPQLTVVARARNATHWFQLRRHGVKMIERETLDSALMTGRSVLETMGWQPHHARTMALRFRRHTQLQLEKQLPHYKDQARLIALAKQGRQQLEQLFAEERDRIAQQRRRKEWVDAESDDA